MDLIKERVHDLYWKEDINCARTMLITLGELFQVEIGRQTVNGAIGLHGAGGYRAQCGLVEGALIFIGIYLSDMKKSESEIISICYQYAEEFTKRFSSLQCYDLRPNGFTSDDPPHLCEKLTCEAIEFARDFIGKAEL